VEPSAGGRSCRRVVYVSRVPPPGGGIAVWTELVLRRGLPGGWSALLVDTRLPEGRREFERSRPSRAEVARTARILASLAGVLAFRRPALVHFNVAPLDAGVYRDLLGVWLARLFRRPVVLHHHGLVSRLEQRPELRLRRRALLAAARCAALNLAVNEASARFLRGALGGRGRVVVLPNFFDEAEWMRPPRGAPAPGARPRACFVGALTRAKGIPELLEAARLAPGVDFHLFGVVSDEMRDLLEHAPPNVTVHGEVGRERLARELAAAQVFVSASPTEGFPLAVVEAMAAGLPVGAIPEMVEAGCGGRLCPPDPEALAAALRDVLANEERRAAMGRSNRERSERLYARSVVLRRLVELYDELSAA
jgi:glycosyltransferase involved in cell wall biosynthesis